MKRPTMHQSIFYQLYVSRKQNGNPFIPIWAFMGETFVKELGVWGYVSYEVGARMSEIWKTNPGLLAREKTTGKSGAKYYQYRIRNDATKDNIIDTDLRAFYDRLEKVRAERPELNASDCKRGV